MNNTMTDNEINESVAKWAGFYVDANYYTCYPNGTHLPEDIFPDFVNSLDAHMQFTLPRLLELHIAPEIIYDTDMMYWQITLNNIESSFSLDSPITECVEIQEIPKALSLAILELEEK